MELATRYEVVYLPERTILHSRDGSGIAMGTCLRCRRGTYYMFVCPCDTQVHPLCYQCAEVTGRFDCCHIEEGDRVA